MPFLLSIALIFALSGSGASMSRTSLFVRPLLEFLFPGADEVTLLTYHGYVRKLAHVIEYGFLGLTAARAFSGSRVLSFRKHWFLWVLFVVLAIASADEISQSFRISRTGSIVDVGIDLVGGILGAAGFLILRQMYRWFRGERRNQAENSGL